MSTLTPKQVGDEMSMYTFRPGVAILPRGRGNFKCFDKGHYRHAACTKGLSWCRNESYPNTGYEIHSQRARNGKSIEDY